MRTICLLAALTTLHSAAARAARGVLYAAPPPTPPPHTAGTATIAPAPCGLTTPCTDLNTSAQARLAAPLAGDFEYGMSGEASAGVSNHGQGGSIGVLGWLRNGDTTLSLGLSVGAARFTGPRYLTLVPQSHP